MLQLCPLGAEGSEIAAFQYGENIETVLVPLDMQRQPRSGIGIEDHREGIGIHALEGGGGMLDGRADDLGD